jgi:hypothetical protein
MTAAELATATGLGRGTVSTTLSRLARAGDITKAARGYQIAQTALICTAGVASVSRTTRFQSGSSSATNSRSCRSAKSISERSRRQRRRPDRQIPSHTPSARQRSSLHNACSPSLSPVLRRVVVVLRRSFVPCFSYVNRASLSYLRDLRASRWAGRAMTAVRVVSAAVSCHFVRVGRRLGAPARASGALPGYATRRAATAPRTAAAPRSEPRAVGGSRTGSRPSAWPSAGRCRTPRAPRTRRGDPVAGSAACCR